MVTKDEWDRIMRGGRLQDDEPSTTSEIFEQDGYGQAYQLPSVFPSDGNNGLTCMAKTRAGTPCKQRAIFRSGRCKFHGGLSTGPKTPEGKARSSQNGPNGRRGNRTHAEKPNPMGGYTT